MYCYGWVMVMRPAITMPVDTPTARNAVYILRGSARLNGLEVHLFAYAMTVPRSCRKKISAIVIGPTISPAPFTTPIRILEASSLEYDWATPAQMAVPVYKVKAVMWAGLGQAWG
jgi:hypothetical protein